MKEKELCPNCQRHKLVPREDSEIKKLKNRINRIVGQLIGINKMIDDNRYCGDILIQLSACTSALEKVSNMILKNHLETCVKEDIKNNKETVFDELMFLLEKLK